MPTQPFQKPWNILYELGPIMETIQSDIYPSKVTIADGQKCYKHDEEYQKINGWYRRILNCSQKLPHVHDAIVRRQKITQGGGCCGMTDLCELLTWIDALRPATVGKVLDEGWREDYEKKVHDKLCCIENIDKQQSLMGNNTFPHIVEIPNSFPDGLPGFSYPNYLLPPLTNFIRPNDYRDPPNAQGDFESHRKSEFIAYNVDKRSSVFGVNNTIGDRLITSPLQSLRSILCGKGDLSLSFNVDLSCSVKLPSLSVSAQRSITIDPCISQYLPPLFRGLNFKFSLSFGGQEFGIYNNFSLVIGNLGTAFRVASMLIPSLKAKSRKGKLSLKCGKAPVGVNRQRSLW